MSERTGVITFKGGPLTLIGPELSTGQDAPDFTLVTNDLATKSLADFAGKVLVLVTVPSLDTPVCDVETRRFNEEAAALGDDVVVVAVSVDLPFAQKRWCGAAGVDRVETLSDYKDHGFGEAYGLLIKELALLTRAVVVVDRTGKISNVQIVGEVTEEPDYSATLAAIKSA